MKSISILLLICSIVMCLGWELQFFSDDNCKDRLVPTNEGWIEVPTVMDLSDVTAIFLFNPRRVYDALWFSEFHIQEPLMNSVPYTSTFIQVGKLLSFKRFKFSSYLGFDETCISLEEDFTGFSHINYTFRFQCKDTVSTIRYSGDCVNETKLSEERREHGLFNITNGACIPLLLKNRLSVRIDCSSPEIFIWISGIVCFAFLLTCIACLYRRKYLKKKRMSINPSP